jgi:prepilin-type N-terminal cleavage/methylation domain-containing protein
MSRRGLTLIELMIVIAAVAVPGIVSATRSSNERNASASLKQIVSAQVVLKTSDLDGNFQSDYWIADVAGLYYICPQGAGVAYPNPVPTNKTGVFGPWVPFSAPVPERGERPIDPAHRCLDGARRLGHSGAVPRRRGHHPCGFA